MTKSSMLLAQLQKNTGLLASAMINKSTVSGINVDSSLSMYTVSSAKKASAPNKSPKSSKSDRLPPSLTHHAQKLWQSVECSGLRSWLYLDKSDAPCWLTTPPLHHHLKQPAKKLNQSLFVAPYTPIAA